MKLPRIKDIRALLIELKAFMHDDYRAEGCEDDSTPSMDVTIGASDDGTWGYQTGDNSFTGSAYGHPHWAVLFLTRRSNCTELARDAISQISELAAQRGE